MFTWISRFLIFVFVFQIFAPELTFAQKNSTATQTNDLWQSVSAQIEKQRQNPLSSAKTLEELEHLYAQQMTALADVYDQADVTDVVASASVIQIVTQMHQLSEEYAQLKKTFQATAKDNNYRATVSAPADHSYVRNNVQTTDSVSNTKALLFLEQFKRNQLSLVDLVEILDPLSSSANDFLPGESILSSALAAEIFVNSIENFLLNQATDPQEKALWMDFIPRLQARTLYRLNHLVDKNRSEDFIMARGTLRILLYQIHIFYTKMGLQDPLTTKYQQQTVTSKRWVMRPTRALYNQHLANLRRQNAQRAADRKDSVLIPPTYEEFCKTRSKAIPHPDVASAPSGYEFVQVPVTTSSATEQQNSAMFEKFMNDFINEMRALKQNKQAKIPNSQEMMLLNLQTQYAARYALLSDRPRALADMVTLLEEQPKQNLKSNYQPTDLQTDFSTVLETMFGVLTETLKISPADPKTIDTLKHMLVEWSFPQHATDTRVLAIGAASLLNSADKWTADAEQIKAFLKNKQSGERTDNSSAEALKISAQDRAVLAAQAVSLYKNLRDYDGTYNSKNYGLDSEQMKVLQDQLVSFINGLLPLEVPQTVWSEQYNRYVADSSHMVRLEQFPLDQLYATNHGPKPVFMYDTAKQPVPLSLVNPVNKFKKRGEDVGFALRLVGAAALWIFGGELMAFGFRALLMTRGAVAMFPQALKVAIKAKNVSAKSRIGRFSSKMRQGIKYGGSMPFQMERIGATVTTTRTEKTTFLTEELSAAGSTVAKERKVMDAPVTRRGFAYNSMTSASGQASTDNWIQRMWKSLWRESPEAKGDVLSFEISQMKDLQATNVTLDAAKYGLTHGVRSPLARARFFQAAQRNGINLDPLWKQRKVTNYFNNGASFQSSALPLWEQPKGLYSRKPDIATYNVVQQNGAYWELAEKQAGEAVAGTSSEPFAFAPWEQFKSLYGWKQDMGIYQAAQKVLDTELHPTYKFWQIGKQVKEPTAPGKLGFWRRTEAGSWEQVSAKDFESYLAQLQSKTAQASSSASLGNAYRTLGISPNASAEQAKKAYHKLAKKYHTDKGLGMGLSPEQITQNDERFKEIADAYDEIKKAFKAGKKVADATEQTEIIDVLAVTLGKQKPTAGFNPLNEGKGLGINSSNAKEDLALRIARHAKNTGQTTRLGVWPLVTNNWMVASFIGGTALFAGWDFLDRAANVVQKPMIESAVTKELQTEMDKYGDILKNDEQDTTPSLPQQPQLTPLTAVNQAHRDYKDHEGALITLPIFATRLATGWKLLPEGTKTNLRIQAISTVRNEAIQENFIGQTYETSLENLLTSLQAQREQFSYDKALEEVAKLYKFPEVLQAIDNYEKALKALDKDQGKGRSSLAGLSLTEDKKQQSNKEKMEQLERVYQKHEPLLEKAINDCLQASYESTLMEQITEVALLKQQIPYYGLNEKNIAELTAQIDQTLAKLNKLRRKGYQQGQEQQINELINQLNEEIQQRLNNRSEEEVAEGLKRSAKQRIQEAEMYFANFFYTQATPAEQTAFEEILQETDKHVQEVLENDKLSLPEKEERIDETLREMSDHLFTSVLTIQNQRFDELAPEAEDEFYQSAY